MPDQVRIGIIGYDTSHSPAFTRLLSDPADPFHVPGGRVVVGFPSYSPDIESSSSRVEGHKRELTEKWGVRLAASLEELVEQVDAVLLESLDGRRHLKEASPVIRAGKPIFIDKPLAASYQEAAEICRLAEANGCPVLSSSSLRFDANILALKEDPELGRVWACDAFSPAALEPTNPGLFWYGIHGVEILYTFMGPGCQTVRCTRTDNYHLAVGIWPEGRVGTMRGTRCGRHEYGATVFGENGVGQTLYSRAVPLYSQLLKEVIPFFRGAPPPVPLEETLEIMAFMQASLISEREGRVVELGEVSTQRLGRKTYLEQPCRG